MTDRQTDEQTNDNHDNSSTVTKVWSAKNNNYKKFSNISNFHQEYASVTWQI